MAQQEPKARRLSFGVKTGLSAAAIAATVTGWAVLDMTRPQPDAAATQQAIAPQQQQTTPEQAAPQDQQQAAPEQAAPPFGRRRHARGVDDDQPFASPDQNDQQTMPQPPQQQPRATTRSSR